MTTESNQEQPVALKRGRKPLIEITEHQRRTLQTIRKHIDDQGIAPTVAELSDAHGVTRSTIQDQIDQLVRKGYLSRQNNKARSILIQKDPMGEPNALVSLPLVGTVAAGLPLLAQENIVTHVLIDPSLIRSGQHFALQVKGSSMTGAGINEGDLLIIRRQALAETGDIVVALLGDEGTVKRLWMREGRIELRPENPEFTPIVIHPDDDFRLIGKVVSVSRTAVQR